MVGALPPQNVPPGGLMPGVLDVTMHYCIIGNTCNAAVQQQCTRQSGKQDGNPIDLLSFMRMHGHIE